MTAPLRVAIAGSFTVQPLGPVLAWWLETIGLGADLVWAPYGQPFQALLSRDGALRANRGGVGIVLVRRCDLDVAATAHDASAGLAAALRASLQASGAPHVVAVCPSGSLDDAENDAADARLVAALRDVGGVDVIAPADVRALYPTRTLFDPYADREGNVPYTEEYFAALATMLARRVRVAKREPKKVILLDCDDTLWDGVVGEVGPDGVGLDEARLELHRFLRAQRDSGVLLAVVSRNDERDVLAVFEQRSEMILRREHLTTWRINWRPKSENIHDIARELSLGVQSFVLLDDDAFACAEAREHCRGLVAIQLPDDPGALPRFLRHVWTLDRGAVTAEDHRRAEAYRVEGERDRARRSMSHEEFLATLGLEVTLSAMDDTHAARVAQLTHRTSQFNATGIRRSEAGIRGLGAHGLACAVVHVRDRFGDYGLTGAVIYAVHDGVLSVDTFLLSCRVLGRGVEERVMAGLAARAEAHGARALLVPFVPTGRNTPYAAFFAALPAARVDAGGTGRSAVLAVDVARNLRVASERTETTLDEATSAPPATTEVVEPFDPREIAMSLWHVDAIRARFRGSGDAEAGHGAIDAIAAFFRDVLRLPAVGLDEDLFDLGGDSIAALGILTRIRDRFGVEIALHELFQMDATVRAFAAEVTSRLERRHPPGSEKA
jgi:FkbH-like protein